MAASAAETGGVRMLCWVVVGAVVVYGAYLESGGGSWKVGRVEAAGRRAVRVWGGSMVRGGGGEEVRVWKW